MPPPATTEPPLVLSPDSSTVFQGEAQTFSVTWAAKRDPKVVWSVVPSPDGGRVAGGVYTAPAASGTFQVVATSRSDPLNRAQATITVPPVSVSVLPESALVVAGAVLPFHVALEGTRDPSVSWTIDPQSGASIDPALIEVEAAAW